METLPSGGRRRGRLMVTWFYQVGALPGHRFRCLTLPTARFIPSLNQLLRFFYREGRA